MSAPKKPDRYLVDRFTFTVGGEDLEFTADDLAVDFGHGGTPIPKRSFFKPGTFAQHIPFSIPPLSIPVERAGIEYEQIDGVLHIKCRCGAKCSIPVADQMLKSLDCRRCGTHIDVEWTHDDEEPNQRKLLTAPKADDDGT